MNQNTLTQYPKLRGFQQHGVTFTKLIGKQAIGTCPFCGKAEKFYVNAESLLWDCKRCGSHGSFSQFLAQRAKDFQKAFRNNPARDLAADRGLLKRTIRSWGVGWNGRWYTIPVDATGKMTDLRRYEIGGKCKSTSGAKVGLVGVNRGTNHIWLCEGEWDGMALYEALAKGHKRESVFAVTGAGSFPKEAADLLQGKEVTVVFDNDEAGIRGELRVANILTGVTKETQFVHWPEDLPDGFDVRDLYLGEHKNGPKTVGYLLDHAQNHPRDTAAVKAGAVPEEMPTGDGLAASVVAKEYRKWLHLRSAEVLSVIFGSVFANRIQGDPLWLFLVGPAGCHERGQPMLMHDGTIRAVEEIVAGDYVMGWDDTFRKVLRTNQGFGRMYRIKPIKGDPFVVNEDHILTLIRTNDNTLRAGEVIDVPVKDYLTWTKAKKSYFKLFRGRVKQFFKTPKDLPIDPHFLGILLGGGLLNRKTGVCTPDPEIIKEIYEQAQLWNLHVTLDGGLGKCTSYLLCSDNSKRNANPLRTALRFLGLFGTTSGTKFIPDIYKHADVESRLEILAGLMDSDGSMTRNVFEYTTKSKRLADDIAYIARSLGMAAYPKPCRRKSQYGTEGTYYRFMISGDTFRVPCRIARKHAGERRQRKNVTRTGFVVERVADAPYYGLTITGDGRYLLGDFTITHNCGKTEPLMSLSDAPLIYTTTTLTAPALISGANFLQGDPSIIPKLDRKVLIVKDFTTILTLQSTIRDEIFGILRDAYDGKIEKGFGNGIRREYESTFGIIAGVTTVIETFSNLSSVLGERFLKYMIREPGTINKGKAMIERALDNVGKENTMRSELKEVAKRALDKEVDVDHLPRLGKRFKSRIVGLAQWVASLRGVVQREKYTGEIQFKPTSEVGTRLAKQLAKLGLGIAIFHDEDTVTDDIYQILVQVARDTAPDRIEEVLRQLYVRADGEFVSTSDLVEWTRFPVGTVQPLLQDLALLKVVQKDPNQTRGYWRVSSAMRKLMGPLGIYDRELKWKRGTKR